MYLIDITWYIVYIIMDIKWIQEYGWGYIWNWEHGNYLAENNSSYFIVGLGEKRWPSFYSSSSIGFIHFRRAKNSPFLPKIFGQGKEEEKVFPSSILEDFLKISSISSKVSDILPYIQLNHPRKLCLVLEFWDLGFMKDFVEMMIER